jgi:myo-inositol 2-dehydrogenase / D-chiro-inositol 1-dehydrogenase
MSGAVAPRARVHVGLLGAGRIAAVHAETLSRNPQVAGVTVHDPVAAAAERLAGATGAAVAGSIDELLRVADAVVIATPTDTHPGLVRAVAAAGLPMFCEKPLALALDETDAVLADVAAAGVQLQVGFQRRFDPGYVAARDAVTSGRMGRVLLVSANAYDHEPPPASYLPSSGGIHLDMLIHEFDVVPWVTGREVVEVYATGAALTDPVFAASDDVDSTAVILTLDDGTPAVLRASRTDPLGYDARLELLGTADSLAVGLDERTPLRPIGPTALAPAGRPYADFIDRFRAAYTAEIDAFIALVQGRGPNGCTGAQARKATVIALAAARSLRERRPVSTVEVTAS